MLFLSMAWFAHAQDQWTGIYHNPNDDAIEVISISKKDGCYALTWGTWQERFPLEMDKKPVSCEYEDQFVALLFGSEEYEFDPLAYDENGRVSEFEILGFDEFTTFRRVD